MKKLVVAMVFLAIFLMGSVAFGTTHHDSMVGDKFTGENGCKVDWKKTPSKGELDRYEHYTCNKFDGPGILEDTVTVVLVDDNQRIVVAVASLLGPKSLINEVAISVGKDLVSKRKCAVREDFSEENMVAFECKTKLDYVIMVKNATEEDALMTVFYMDELEDMVPKKATDPEPSGWGESL